MQLSGDAPPLAITTDDFNRVSLLAEVLCRQSRPVGAFLMKELERAQLCMPWEAGGVALGMHVSVASPGHEGVFKTQLVYPGRNPQRATCVMSPLGAALLGMHPGRTIAWRSPSGRSEIRVMEAGWTQGSISGHG